MMEQADEKPTLRAYLRRDLVQSGFPPAEADETLDLAWHAADSAMATLCDVAKRGSLPVVRENALSIGLTVASIQVRQAIEQVAECFESDGRGHHVTRLQAEDVSQ